MNKLFLKISLKVALLLAILFALGLYLAPRKVSHTQAEVCSPLYDRPIFNPYPVTQTDVAGTVKDDCSDFPTMAIRNTNTSTYTHDVSGSVGDEFFVRVYVHNGGRQDLGNQTLAKNVNAYITVDGNYEPEHVMGVTVTGQDINGNPISSVAGSVRVLTGSNEALEVVPGSAEVLDRSLNRISNPNIFGESFNVPLGDMNGCFEYLRFIRFKVRVVEQKTSKSGSISAVAGNQIGNQCLRTGTVTWSSNTNSTEVYVKDLQSGQEKLYSADTNGNGETPWLTPGGNYQYTLYSTENGQKTKLSDYTLTVPNLDCEKPSVSGDFSFSVDKTQYCVYSNNPARTEVTSYSITADSSLVGQTIFWSSKFEGRQTPEIDSPVGRISQTSGVSAGWNGVSHQWTSTQIGYWEKTVKINGLTKTVTFSVKNCDTVTPPTPPAPTPRVSGTIYATYTNRIANQCLYTGYVYWSTQNVSSAQVYVKNLNTNLENLHSGDTQKAFPGNDTPWLTPGNSFVFTLYNTENGQKTKLADHTVNVPSLNCVTPVVEGNKDFTFEVDNNLCVAYIPHYRIQATTNLNYKPVRITSRLNGASVSDVSLGTTDGSGFWSYADTAWTSSQIGTWTKTATIDGVQKTVSFNVRDCSTPQTLTCSPTNQTVNVGQTASFTAFGGNGSYTWSAPNSSQISGSGSNFSTSYSNSTTGNQIVTLQSGGASRACSVFVNPINTQNGILSINKTVKNLTNGSGYGKSVTADNGNRVSYQVTVGVSSGNVNNVILNESLPSNFNYIGGSLRVDGQSVSDSQLSNIALGNLTSGQTKTVILEGYVTGNSGQCQTTITNTASVSGSGTAWVSDSATVYINQNCGGGGGYAQLSISKLVRNQNSSSYFSESVNAQNGDRVQFEITVRNVGNTTANNVRVRDFWNAGLSLVGYTVSVDGQSFSGSSIIDSDLSIGSLSVNQQKRITFEATVFASGQGSIQNTARATSDNASSVSDDAWVFLNNPQVAGGNVNLSYQKRAFNETKNADAQSVTASREDYITYTLTVSNNGNAPANSFVITDDLSGVLNYADISDYGGGTLSGTVLNFPNVMVPAYGSVSKSFKVRVKYNLPASGSFVMNNSYGNTVSIRIGNPSRPVVLGAFTAPKTGADTKAFVFAGLATLLFAIYRKKQKILKWF